MNRRAVLATLIIVALVACTWFVCYRVRGRVLATGRLGDAVIAVREIQVRPISLTGLLGMNGKVYRCEYYPHDGWPMFSCESFAEESYEVRQVKIIPVGASATKVLLDDTIAFECEDGKWRRARP